MARPFCGGDEAVSRRRSSDDWRVDIYLVSPITEAAFIITRIDHAANLVWLRPLESPWLVVPNRISALVAAGYHRVRPRKGLNRNSVMEREVTDD